MNKRHYEHTLPNIRGSLSNTYVYRQTEILILISFKRQPPTCHYGKTGALLLRIIRIYVSLGGLSLFRLRFSVKWAFIKARISDSKYHVLW